MRKITPYILGLLYNLFWILYLIRSWTHVSTGDFQPMWVFFIGAICFVVYAVSANKIHLSRFHVVLAITVVVCALAAKPITSVDFMHFLFDGSLLHTVHISPYVVTPLQIAPTVFSTPFLDIWWAQNPSPYGPLWQLVMWAINVFSTNTLVGGIVLLKLLNLGGIILCAHLLHRITHNTAASWLLVLNPIVLINTIDTPHCDIWIAAGILFALAYQQRLLAWSFAGPVLGALVKIHAIAFVPFFMREQIAKKMLLGVATATAAIGALAVLAPFSLQHMLRANLLGSNSPLNDSSLAYLFFPHGASAATVFMVALLCSAAVYGTVFILFTLKRLSQINALIICALIVPLFLTGLIYPWHWMVALVLLHLHEPKISLPFIATITLGGIAGPIPAFAIAFSGVLVWYVWFCVRPRVQDVLQYANHGKKTHTKN